MALNRKIARRKGIHSDIQEVVGDIEGLLIMNPIDEVKLRARYMTLIDTVAELKELNDEIWTTMEADVIAADVVENRKIVRPVKETIVKAEQALKTSVTTPAQADAAPVTATNSEIRTPKLPLPKFDGDVLQWRVLERF